MGARAPLPSETGPRTVATCTQEAVRLGVSMIDCPPCGNQHRWFWVFVMVMGQEGPWQAWHRQARSRSLAEVTAEGLRRMQGIDASVWLEIRPLTPQDAAGFTWSPP